jgi:hypothetical protein
MSGTQPTFFTGATAKIRLNGKTLAFCSDFSCSIQVLTKAPKVLGQYESDSIEPLSYSVSGSFSILRYAKDIKQALGPGHAPNGLAENDAGNGVGNWGTAWGGKFGDIMASAGVGNDGRAQEALDPSKFSGGTTFDIQVFQKVSMGIKPSAENIFSTVTDFLGGGNVDIGNIGKTVAYLGVLNIRSARITQADFNINKKSVAQDRFNFVAIFADGDGFVANASKAAS